MTKEEIKKMIKDRGELAERSFNTYQQLQGQISLLRDLYEKALREEVEAKKKLPENKPETEK